MTETAAAFQSTVLDQRFRFRENRTTLGRDTVAGVTTFTAISYIIFLDPQILGFAGIAPPEERPSLRRRPRDPRAASQSTR